MGRPNNRKLKNLLINPAYQLKYVFWLCTTGLTLFMFYAVNLYLHIKENYAILVELSPMTPSAKKALYLELDSLIVELAVGSLCFMIGIIILGLIITHRTAGPLFQFKRVFEDIKAGKLDARIKLRPKDDFIDVAESFNGMIDQVLKKD